MGRRTVLQNVLEPEALAAIAAREDVTIVHVGDPSGYAQAHVPGALCVSPRDLVSGQRPAPGLLPAVADLERLFAGLGYQPDRTIVAYDDEGGGWAGRLVWTLEIMGHRRWAYLDGGIHAWTAEGFDVERTPRVAERSPVRLQLDTLPLIGGDEILSRLNDPDLVLWDSRSREEYEGRKVVSSRGGRIPGAKHLDWLDLMDRSRSLRLRRDLPSLLEASGITPDKLVVPYCQTHHRSALSYLVARCLGYPRVRAYAGSWSEWGNRNDTPVATGP